MRPTLLCTTLIGLLSCAEKPGVDDSAALGDSRAPAGLDSAPPVDLDGDGYASDADCDDGRADVHPRAEELCNGVDDNCNGVIDEEFSDIDGDGLSDCLDVEDCDGLDNDGDGRVDEDLGDADGDGVPDCLDAEDCDGLDNDSDGRVDEGFDSDGDGYTTCGSARGAPDCDDGDRGVSPGAEEIDGDGVDNDCDGAIDSQTWAEGELIITEVMANPGNVSDPAGEWFEVLNVSGRSLWLNGLVIQSSLDGDYHVIDAPDKLTLEPGEVAILGSNADAGSNGEVPVRYAYSGVSLLNEADEILLSWGPKIIDQVSWDIALGSPDVQGASLSLDPYFYDPDDNDGLGVWCAATEPWDAGSDRGSPGAENEVCELDHDGDGFTGLEDCDDYDPAVNPDAPMPGNRPPIAAAGADQTYSESVTCVSTGYDYECSDCGAHSYTLDGSGSSDADGHPLRYQWSIVDGGDLASLSGADEAVATLTMTGPSTEYGEVESASVTVQLEVTDCAGASGSDTITLTFECSGD